jgi:hypothetical protein
MVAGGAALVLKRVVSVGLVAIELPWGAARAMSSRSC